MYNDFDTGLGAPARKSRRGKGAARARRSDCKTIVFKRRKRGGKVLPRSQWREITRCAGRRLRATNPRQCKSKKTGRYIKCPAGARRPARRKRR